MTKPRQRKRSRADAEEERASLVGLGLAAEKLRREAGMTREAVAKTGILAVSTITQIEKGLKVEPRWETFRRLAKGLSVELDELLRLGIELAPGAAGDRLRQRERENARHRRALEKAKKEQT